MDEQSSGVLRKNEGQPHQEAERSLDIFIKNKTLYHGSTTSGIKNFNPAEEDTVGSGIYFTSEETNAAGYAKRRVKTRGGTPIVYKVEVDNLRLVNLTTDENVKKILDGFKTLMEQEMSDEAIPWYQQAVLRQSIEAIAKGEVGSENLKTATFNHTALFTKHLQSLGYDGLVAIEGGEGEDIGRHDSYVIFDADKTKVLEENIVNK